MSSELQTAFLELVKLGIKTSSNAIIPKGIEWNQLKALADAQGLSAIVLDGLNSLPLNSLESYKMPQVLSLQWIGEVMHSYEDRYAAYERAISSLAGFYNQYGYKMMVLKGYGCSIDWPKPEHRPCGDIDIWLFGKQKEADALLAKEKGIKVDASHHHHTVFNWCGFTVENHYDFVNVHAHRSSREIEKVFKKLGDVENVNNGNNSNTNITNVMVLGEKVYLPSANLHALFLMRHLAAHFAAVGISLRQMLDWAFFVEKHGKAVDWEWLDSMLEKYHMKDFFNLVNAICVEDLGFPSYIFPSGQFIPSLKERVLNDILDPGFTIAEPNGFMRRLVYKYRRWQGNAWKQELCYSESRWEMFWTGIWAKMLKPANF